MFDNEPPEKEVEPWAAPALMVAVGLAAFFFMAGALFAWWVMK